jgi:hypothetical protein
MQKVNTKNFGIVSVRSFTLTFFYNLGGVDSPYVCIETEQGDFFLKFASKWHKSRLKNASSSAILPAGKRLALMAKKALKECGMKNVNGYKILEK